MFRMQNCSLLSYSLFLLTCISGSFAKFMWFSIDIVPLVDKAIRKFGAFLMLKSFRPFCYFYYHLLSGSHFFVEALSSEEVNLQTFVFCHDSMQNLLS